MATHSTKTTEAVAGTENEAYRKAAAATLASINEVISPADLTFLSHRSLAEVEALQEEVAAVVPAGNIVGLVLSGLVRLRGRNLPVDQAKSDVSALMRGIEMLPRNILPGTIYGTFFAGPAAVLAAYQKLLTLAGKDPDSAFPEGLWQFYLEFALREDSARHANETLGFHTALARYGLNLSAADQLAAWVCAVSQLYFQYDELLFNEWHELVYLNLLEKAVLEAKLGHKISFQRVPQAWAAQRPYHRRQDAQPDEPYSLYRRRRFDQFLQSRLAFLPEAYKSKMSENYVRRMEHELAAYQQQLTILASLRPERYRESKNPLQLWQTRVGVIHRGCYYLLPACHTDHAGRPLLFATLQPDATSEPLAVNAAGELRDPAGRLLQSDRQGRVFEAKSDQICGYLRPAPFQAIRRQTTAIFQRQDGVPAALDEQLLAIGRTEQERARQKIADEAAQQELAALQTAPVIINWDQQAAAQPLAYIRQGKRGLGDHALTIFRTNQSLVFDQSHIFFDGTWGMAISEILTGEAISWAAYFNNLETPEPARQAPYHLNLPAQPVLEKFPQKVTREVSAESAQIDTGALYTLCKLLPKRHPDLKLTVNDLLILYRCEFGHEYRPSSKVEDALFELQAEGTPETQAVYRLINEILVSSQANNPSIMMPMNATGVSPRERLYPTAFRNPFANLWTRYQHASNALNRYTVDLSPPNWAIFTEERRALLAQLHYFGELLRTYKKVALEGGSTTTATMKLLAHLPDSVLKLLDEIPRRIDVLNEVIKGEEVFSNVGRVARESSLSRFISAKDDNENKTLVWAVLTDDNDVMHLSLRDFRPHVAALDKINKIGLAEIMLNDYLEAFTTGFNQFVARLLDILNATATHTSKELTP
ncbi:MAG: hypothetical protein AB1801_13455 [Chloroflexota bacterium]